jgi:hypothetical protein
LKWAMSASTTSHGGMGDSQIISRKQCWDASIALSRTGDARIAL